MGIDFDKMAAPEPEDGGSGVTLGDIFGDTPKKDMGKLSEDQPRLDKPDPLYEKPIAQGFAEAVIDLFTSDSANYESNQQELEAAKREGRKPGVFYEGLPPTIEAAEAIVRTKTKENEEYDRLSGLTGAASEALLGTDDLGTYGNLAVNAASDLPGLPVSSFRLGAMGISSIPARFGSDTFRSIWETFSGEPWKTDKEMIAEGVTPDELRKIRNRQRTLFESLPAEAATVATGLLAATQRAVNDIQDSPLDEAAEHGANLALSLVYAAGSDLTQLINDPVKKISEDPFAAVTTALGAVGTTAKTGALLKAGAHPVNAVLEGSGLATTMRSLGGTGYAKAFGKLTTEQLEASIRASDHIASATHEAFDAATGGAFRYGDRVSPDFLRATLEAQKEADIFQAAAVREAQQLKEMAGITHLGEAKKNLKAIFKEQAEALRTHWVTRVKGVTLSKDKLADLNISGDFNKAGRTGSAESNVRFGEDTLVELGSAADVAAKQAGDQIKVLGTIQKLLSEQAKKDPGNADLTAMLADPGLLAEPANLSRLLDDTRIRNSIVDSVDDGSRISQLVGDLAEARGQHSELVKSLRSEEASSLERLNSNPVVADVADLKARIAKVRARIKAEQSSDSARIAELEKQLAMNAEAQELNEIQRGVLAYENKTEYNYRGLGNTPDPDPISRLNDPVYLIQREHRGLKAERKSQRGEARQARLELGRLKINKGNDKALESLRVYEKELESDLSKASRSLSEFESTRGAKKAEHAVTASERYMKRLEDDILAEFRIPDTYDKALRKYGLNVKYGDKTAGSIEHLTDVAAKIRAGVENGKLTKAITEVLSNTTVTGQNADLVRAYTQQMKLAAMNAEIMAKLGASPSDIATVFAGRTHLISDPHIVNALNGQQKLRLLAAPDAALGTNSTLLMRKEIMDAAAKQALVPGRIRALRDEALTSGAAIPQEVHQFEQLSKILDNAQKRVINPGFARSKGSVVKYPIAKADGQWWVKITDDRLGEELRGAIMRREDFEHATAIVTATRDIVESLLAANKMGMVLSAIKAHVNMNVGNIMSQVQQNGPLALARTMMRSAKGRTKDRNSVAYAIEQLAEDSGAVPSANPVALDLGLRGDNIIELSNRIAMESVTKAKTANPVKMVEAFNEVMALGGLMSQAWGHMDWAARVSAFEWQIAEAYAKVKGITVPQAMKDQGLIRFAKENPEITRTLAKRTKEIIPTVHDTPMGPRIPDVVPGIGGKRLFSMGADSFMTPFIRFSLGGQRSAISATARKPLTMGATAQFAQGYYETLGNEELQKIYLSEYGDPALPTTVLTGEDEGVSSASFNPFPPITRTAQDSFRNKIPFKDMVSFLQNSDQYGRKVYFKDDESLAQGTVNLAAQMLALSTGNGTLKKFVKGWEDATIRKDKNVHVDDPERAFFRQFFVNVLDLSDEKTALRAKKRAGRIMAVAGKLEDTAGRTLGTGGGMGRADIEQKIRDLIELAMLVSLVPVSQEKKNETGVKSRRPPAGRKHSE